MTVKRYTLNGDRMFPHSEGRWVFGEDYDALRRDFETEIEINGVLRLRLAEVESQNRVLWDVASDREARLAEYELLKRAVNESGDCLPTCDANAHDDHCPNVNMHVVLQDQQREVERLRSRLAEVEAEKSEYHGKAAALMVRSDIERLRDERNG